VFPITPAPHEIKIGKLSAIDIGEVAVDVSDVVTVDVVLMIVPTGALVIVEDVCVDGDDNKVVKVVVGTPVVVVIGVMDQLWETRLLATGTPLEFKPVQIY
jgi:hypothetical protein